MDSGTDYQSNCKIEENEPRNGMDRLPSDISLNIFSRLPVTSLIQSRFVSRAWNTLSHEASLLNLHLSRIEDNNPCLIFRSEDPIRSQLFFVEFSDPFSNEKVRKIDTPVCTSMPDQFNVLGSCNGLLCLSDALNNDPFYIHNPFTRKHVELPKSRQFEEQKVVSGFGFHPITNEYKVVKIVYYRNPYNGPLPRPIRRCGYRGYTQSEVQIYSLGNNTWRSIGEVPDFFQRRSLEHIFESSELLLVNGRLHWVARPRPGVATSQIIVSFDLSDEQFREIPRPACGGLDRCHYLLLVLRGRLSAAVYSDDGKVEIWVMKDYSVEESWIKQFDIEACSSNFMNEAGLQKSTLVSWRNWLRGNTVRIFCLLKNGDIMLEFNDGTLASYEPQSGKTTNLMFRGMPDLFQTIVHVGSLNWIDLPLPINT